MDGRTRLLYIHASEDEALRRALETHLSSLEQEGLIEGWHAGLLSAGDKVDQQLTSQVNQAQVVVLLLSADFMHSEQCQALLQLVQTARQNRHIQVVPILVRPVDWRSADLQDVQGLPRNGQAVTQWSNQDAAWVEVAECLRALLAGDPASTAPNRTRTPMAKTKDSPGSPSFRIDGGNHNSPIIIGSSDVKVSYQSNLPQRQSVNLRAELAAIREILAGVEATLRESDKRRMEKALDEAQQEALEPAPRTEVIGESMERALVIVKHGGSLASAAETLRPHVEGLAGWLGEAWHKLLSLVPSST